MGLKHKLNARLMWMLILTDDVVKQRRLEHHLEASRDAVIDYMLGHSHVGGQSVDWSAMPALVKLREQHAPLQEKLRALRQAWTEQYGDRFTDGQERERAAADREFHEALRQERALEAWAKPILLDAEIELDIQIIGHKKSKKALVDPWVMQMLEKKVARYDALFRSAAKLKQKGLLNSFDVDDRDSFELKFEKPPFL